MLVLLGNLGKPFLNWKTYIICKVSKNLKNGAQENVDVSKFQTL